MLEEATEFHVGWSLTGEDFANVGVENLQRAVQAYEGTLEGSEVGKRLVLARLRLAQDVKCCSLVLGGHIVEGKGKELILHHSLRQGDGEAVKCVD